MANENLIETKNIADVTLISFSQQNIGAGTGVERVSTELVNFVESNKPPKIVIDFTDVRFFSSQALGMLIDIWRKIEKYNGKMVISGINLQLYRIFKITNLNKIFDFYDDSDQAVKSFE